jgi:hypothetical protein
MIDRTPTKRSADAIGRAALQLLVSGDVGDESLRRSSIVAPAVPVLVPGAGLHSWFVPVTLGDRLVAFFQFLPDGTLMRFSSFPRRSGESGGCPAAADWLDRERMQTRAAGQRQTGETIGEPFLTFDVTPDRLVWAVPLSRASGEVRLIYFAGDAVYTSSPAGGLG